VHAKQFVFYQAIDYFGLETNAAYLNKLATMLMKLTTQKLVILVLFITNLTFGQDSMQIKVDELRNITDMPYICRDTIDKDGCGQTIFWNVVKEKLEIIPYLIDKLDDTTKTCAYVPNTGGKWTVADIAFSAIQEIIVGIPTFDLLGVEFDKNGCGYCAYWFHLGDDIQNRFNFKIKVKDWYLINKNNLIWIKDDRIFTCECSFKHPNGGHYKVG
jgi:hypothetical protein